MTAEQMARLAVEYWRASGARTITRLEGLIVSLSESYHGPAAQWGPAVRDLVDAAMQTARARVQWQAQW